MTLAVLVCLIVIMLLVARVMQLSGQVQAQQREFVELRQQLESRSDAGTTPHSSRGVVFVIMTLLLMITLALMVSA